MYVNRFFSVETKPEGIDLPLSIGTIIHEASGLRIITAWGKHNNQYWTEAFEKKDVLWSAAGYNIASQDDICKSSEIIKLCLKSYIVSFEAYYEKWFKNEVSESLYDSHINIFKERLADH